MFRSLMFNGYSFSYARQRSSKDLLFKLLVQITILYCALKCQHSYNNKILLRKKDNKKSVVSWGMEGSGNEFNISCHDDSEQRKHWLLAYQTPSWELTISPVLLLTLPQALLCSKSLLCHQGLCSSQILFNNHWDQVASKLLVPKQ